MLLRPRRIEEAYWAGGGAALLVIARLIPISQAAHAVYEGFDVYLFLTGMMVLSELAREEHVFEWAAGFAARHARKSPRRLFTLVYLVGALVTALLSNDATAVVLTPAVLAVIRRARVDPKPYLLSCALIANAASFVLPISNASFSYPRWPRSSLPSSALPGCPENSWVVRFTAQSNPSRSPRRESSRSLVCCWRPLR
jgi:arsenical pump membrane protein